MITRRDILGVTGVMAASSAVAANVSALSMFTTPSHIAKPVVLITDNKARKLGLGAASYDAVQAVSVSPVTQKMLHETVLSNLIEGAKWLASHEGSSMIFVVDADHGFMIDELLKESRAKTLFKGEHFALALNSGPVRHLTTELPVSAGVASSLPESGVWTASLMASLAKVANRSWQPVSAREGLAPSNVIRPDSAELALATYVIEI